LRAEVLFIRAQSTIRADGPPFAQEPPSQCKLPAYILGVVVERPLRALRANRLFCADEKRIRTDNTVMVNIKRRARGYTRSPRCNNGKRYLSHHM
jgi:hypothetical protein